MAKNVLITGGAGFIGRWVVKAFLDDTKDHVFVLDDFSNGMVENLAEFRNEPRLVEVKKGGIQQVRLLREMFRSVKPDVCVHLAAQINVQDSIDNPGHTFDADVRGAFDLLELCRVARVPMVFMSTCMVYDLVGASGAIGENHPVLPRSPYAGAKLAAENMVISYWHAYRLPTTVMRPFNTYGPHQKGSGEGGVVSIFLSRQIMGKDLNIYGTGLQTRDLLYVEDCADFVLRASLSKRASGQIINAATGDDVTINTLARMAIETAPVRTPSRIRRVKHIHPQSEIMKLCGNYDKAKKMLGWKPVVDLDEGLRRTRTWLAGLIEKGNMKWL